MGEVSLREAAARLDLTPLEVVLRCSLRGVPCSTGTIDEDALPILGAVRQPAPSEDGSPEPVAVPGDETEEEARHRIVRRILERLSTMGKFWPARTERRATARGLEGPDVGLALRATDALVACGLMREEHRAHEPRLGLERDRRSEITDIIAGRPIGDEQLRAWVEEG